MMQICTHDGMCGMPAAVRMLDRVLQHIGGKAGVWFARKASRSNETPRLGRAKGLTPSILCHNSPVSCVP